MSQPCFATTSELREWKPFDSTYVTVGGVAFVFLLLVCGIILAARRPCAARLGLLTIVITAAILCQLWDHPGQRFSDPAQLDPGARRVAYLLMAWAAALVYDLFLTLEKRPHPLVTGYLIPPKTVNGAVRQKHSGSVNPACFNNSSSVTEADSNPPWPIGRNSRASLG